VTANDEHARRLAAEADAAMKQRRTLLCASVALSTTKTVSAARRALRDWDGPGEVKTAALELLDRLADAAGT
jgi:hypothetical protein